MDTNGYPDVMLEMEKLQEKIPPAAEWRTLALNPATDRKILQSPRDTKGTPAERGTDLLAHTAPSGSVYYYLWHWTTKQNETCICQLITEDSAKHFIREQCGGSETAGDFDHDELEVYLPGMERAGMKKD